VDRSQPAIVAAIGAPMVAALEGGLGGDLSPPPGGLDVRMVEGHNPRMIVHP
jgi:hypothetical protein